RFPVTGRTRPEINECTTRPISVNHFKLEVDVHGWPLMFLLKFPVSSLVCFRVQVVVDFCTVRVLAHFDPPLVRGPARIVMISYRRFIS
ncbi:MAG: hypothetical protein WAL51_04925, partial [Candidatus Acidiferrales bacterium]